MKTFSGMARRYRASLCSRSALISAVAIGMGFSGSTVMAQTADEAAARSTGDQIAEIVVTAQKRAQNVQDVPVAVTALGSQRIEQKNATSLADLRSVAPNVVLQPLGGLGNTTAFVIRGIGVGDPDQSFDPAVGIVVDGVFINESVGAVLDTFDLDQIEILRGPQGTLFGKNTTGGVVSMVSKRPSGEFGVELDARIGNYDELNIRGAVDLPIAGDVLATRLSFRSYDRDGYVTNPAAKGGIDSVNVQGLHAVTVFKPSTAFDASLTLDYSNDKSGVAAGQNMAQRGQGFLICSPPAFASCADGDPTVSGSSLRPGNINQKIFFAAGTINVHIPGHTVTSVTGYRDMKYDQRFDVDGTNLRFVDVYSNQKSNQFTQELRISSDSGPSSKLNYVFGLFYYASSYLNIKGRDLTDSFGAFNPLLRNNLTQEWARGKTRSYAAFGQVDYELVDGLTATVGARYSEEKKNIAQTYSGKLSNLPDQIAARAAGVLLPPDFTGKVKTDNFSPKASISYRPSNDVMTYASFSRGFKSGGFNNRAGNLAGALPYNDEKVTSWEVGVKSDLFDRTVRLNLAAFSSDYDDLQRQVNVNVNGLNNTLVLNAGKARIRGIEAEGEWRVVPQFRIYGSAGYTDAKYLDFCAELPRGKHLDPVGRGVTGCSATEPLATDNRDLKLRFVPEFQANLGATYDIDLSNGSTVSVNGEMSYTSSVYLNDPNDINGFQPSVTLFDASIRYRDARDRFTVAFFGKNLSNKQYLLNYTNGGDLTSVGWYGAPRTYGLQVSTKF